MTIALFKSSQRLKIREMKNGWIDMIRCWDSERSNVNTRSQNFRYFDQDHWFTLPSSMFQGRVSASPFPLSLSLSPLLAQSAGKAGLGEEAFHKGDAAPREKETNSINVVAAHCFRTCRLCFVPARKLHGRETPRAGGFSSPTFRHLLQGDLLFTNSVLHLRQRSSRI